jgi:hypothetical protein
LADSHFEAAVDVIAMKISCSVEWADRGRCGAAIPAGWRGAARSRPAANTYMVDSAIKYHQKAKIERN